MVGDRHTGLADIGVGAVDVDALEAGAFDDLFVHGSLANTGFASKVYCVLARIEDEVNGLCEVEPPDK